MNSCTWVHFIISEDVPCLPGLNTYDINSWTKWTTRNRMGIWGKRGILEKKSMAKEQQHRLPQDQHAIPIQITPRQKRKSNDMKESEVII